MSRPPISLCRVYETRSDAAVLADKLRGAEVFKVLQEEPSHGIKVFGMTKDGGAPQPTQGVVLADLSVLEAARDYTATILERDLVILIVDVHFSLHDPELAFAIQPGRTERTRDEELDEKTRDYWRDPERVTWAKGVLEAADAVITPHGSWTWELHRYNKLTVTVPDVVDPASGAKFYRYLMEVILETVKPKLPLWRRLLWPVVRPVSMWGVENTMLDDLKHRDIDWSYTTVDE